ncbi:hypothetical protein PENSUB_3446 [Penicillium subrubescens]|uniref:Uncharacterized protein n=1 Tax=Penicillium subrubescens TaxID=1316194 RepID=A0A1Q5URF7_9EURO|nr:hypothetical protein PENSUB_3446 [Penicillium subrubescens]
MPGLGLTRLSVEDTTHALTEMSTFIENKRLKYCVLSVPIQWVAATMTRIALARSWLVAHLSLIASDDLISDLCQQRREVLFQTAIEVLEFTHLLESSDETAHWSWMFEMYRQWHATDSQSYLTRHPNLYTLSWLGPQARDPLWKAGRLGSSK